MTSDHFPIEYFRRHDEEDDIFYYGIPRYQTYLDSETLAKLEQVFASILPPEGQYLDLMAGWRSHLPEVLRPTRVIGLGLNADEMSANPQLDEFVCHDLNKQPSLPFKSAHFGAVVCTVSVQYLIQPVEVFKEVHRILKPGGQFVVAFSDRCFQEKVIAIWLEMSQRERQALVTNYLNASGAWDSVMSAENEAGTLNPLTVIWAQKP